nr:FeoA family protein [uncultured Eisenbergiella sp.]
MTLYEGQVGGQYYVEDIGIEQGISRRLQALGLIEGTKVKMLNRKKNGSLIIYVRGTRLALGKHITSGIVVKGVETDEEG